MGRGVRSGGCDCAFKAAASALISGAFDRFCCHAWLGKVQLLGLPLQLKYVLILLRLVLFILLLFCSMPYIVKTALSTEYSQASSSCMALHKSWLQLKECAGIQLIADRGRI